ncbi:MAG: SpoIIE family protein phosphatase, partial [Acidobacteria bacterium]|nr:SpoIIE family protein phosphatase [Acidobacteriota bacterium]
MTAWGSVELAVQAMQIGGRDFIQKPWDNDRLLSVLRRQIEEGKMLREKKRRENASARLMKELEDAREIQQRLLPKEMPKLEGCEIQAAWQPVSAVGGDYFDAIQLGDASVAFCVADVSGKGLPAALLMSNIQATVKAFSHDTLSPAEMCTRINRVLCDNIGDDKFITFFYGVLDTSTRLLRFANAGHIPPLLVRTNGSHERLSEGGTVLGILRHAAYNEAYVEVTQGDRVVLITDGITEATNGAGEEFGMDRLIELVERSKSAYDLQSHILDAVSAFSGQDLQDDATVLVVSIL